MSSFNTSFAETVGEIRQSLILFVQIWLFCLFALGVVGQSLNIYVFTRPKFRLNPCARYFLASTLSGYIVVGFTLPLRVLQMAYNIDVFIYSLPICRILPYVLSCSKVLPSWFITLASIDRFLCSSTSVTVRGWSNIRVASRAILLTVLFIGLAYIHIPFNYTILYPPRTCTFISSTYQAFQALWNLIFWSWIPTICMLIFGLLIIRHIRQGKMRVGPPNQLQGNQKKTDRQLIQMLLIQSFVFGSTTTVFSIGSLYISITNNLWMKNDLEKMKDNFLSNILYSIANIGPCLSFYLFTLSSQLFRRELMNLFHWRQPVPVVYTNNIPIVQRT